MSIQEQTIKHRLGMLEELGLPIIMLIARHTKLTIIALKFLAMFIGITKRSGKVGFAAKGDFCFEIDKYEINFWVRPIGKSDESRWSLRIVTKSMPFSMAYKGVFA